MFLKINRQEHSMGIPRCRNLTFSLFVSYCFVVSYCFLELFKMICFLCLTCREFYRFLQWGISLITVPKLWISQSEALFTVMTFYDIKSLTWYPTISWTVCETRIFLADFSGKNYNRNTTKRKTITFVKRESNLFNGKRGEKNTISRQNWKRLHWRALAWTLRTALKLFSFQNGAGFSKFLS